MLPATARRLTWISLSLLLIAASAPCAVPNRWVAALSLALAIFSLVVVGVSASLALRKNRSQMEEELRSWNAWLSLDENLR